MGPEFYVEQSMLAKNVVSTEVGLGTWGYSVLIWVISTAIFSNAIAHRWSVHNALQNNIDESLGRLQM